MYDKMRVCSRHSVSELKAVVDLLLSPFEPLAGLLTVFWMDLAEWKMDRQD